MDREEHPDLDQIYMAAVVAMTGQGGRPMTDFLTPGDVQSIGGCSGLTTRSTQARIESIPQSVCDCGAGAKAN